jgi:peptide/nickel transport system permease protein
MKREKIKNLFGFIFFELTLKSALILFIATFFCAFLLSITPQGKKFIIQIREDISVENETKNESKVTFPGLYFGWLKNTFNGNLGVSRSGQSVISEGFEKLLTTLTLSFVSLILLIALSFLIGLSKVKKYNPIILFVFFISTLPAFFLGYLMIGLFSSNSSTFLRYTLAILTLTLSSGVIYEFSTAIKHTMKTEMGKDYIQLAKAKGLSTSIFPVTGSIEFHAFRNSLIKIISRISSLIPITISSSIIIEQVFGIHGLSFMLLDGLSDKDFNRILLVILMAVAIVRAGSLISNFLYIIANPQYKYYA